MNWYEKTDGTFINLDLVRFIERDGREITFIFDNDHWISEFFDSEKVARKALIELWE